MKVQHYLEYSVNKILYICKKKLGSAGPLGNNIQPKELRCGSSRVLKVYTSSIFALHAKIDQVVQIIRERAIQLHFQLSHESFFRFA
jgi:hypothetical protein